METALFLIILIALSALFSSSETALFSLRQSEVLLMERGGDRRARIIARLKHDPHRILVTILAGNTVVNVLIGSLSAMFAVEGTGSLGVGMITGLSTVALLLFGEIFPKSWAITHNKFVARFVAFPIYACYIGFYPIASIFVWFERRISARFTSPSHGMISEEEIRIMAELGLKQGEIDHHERQMIENIFDFDDIPVGEIMTDNDAIEELNGAVPVEQIAYFVSQSGFSRFPVYEDTPGNMIGYVHTNDVMRVLNSDNRGLPLAHVASPLTRVDETTSIEKVFRLMTKERSHMFLVHKKAVPTEVIGLVTMEDILEEIMGEIEDEGDKRAAHSGKK